MDSQQSSAKAERIYIRLDPESKKVLSKAAGYSDESTSSFVRRAALETAMRLIRDMSVLRLSGADSIAFIKALDEPPAPNKAFRKAAVRYKKAIS